MSLALLLASSRSEGNTRTLVDLAFPQGLGLFIDVQELTMGYYRYDERNAADDFLPLVSQMLLHSTWIIATPLYWYSMSAQAKTFLDRLTELLTVYPEKGRLLRGKRLAVLCTGTDPQLPDCFNEPFRLSCAYLGMAFIGTHYCRFDERVPVLATARQSAQEFAQEVLRQDAMATYAASPPHREER